MNRPINDNLQKRCCFIEHDLKFKTPQRESKLDPYKDYLKQRYDELR